MVTVATEQTDGGETLELPPSFTTLSTIAVQAGQSQITISVLRSGALIHLQLVQVQPSLSEIGRDQDENQTLVQDHQQLLHKLQKHEGEVLSVASGQSAQRRDGGMKKEEEEGLYVAMAASVEEGWSLLLRLLHMRQEVLMMASEFYCRASEFSDSLDEYEDQIGPGNGGLTEAAYDCIRRELLQKSLRVLTSSNILLERLRQLQRTEALQRSGGVLQAENSPYSRGVVLRLEGLLETLQDRRRTADQMFRLQLQRPDSNMETGGKLSWDCSLPGGQIFDQNLKLGSTSADKPELEPELGDLHPVCGPSETDLQFGFGLILETKSGSEATGTWHPGSRLLQNTEGQGGGLQPEAGPGDPSKSGSTLSLKAESRSDLEVESDDPRDPWVEFQPDLKIESSSDLQSDSEDTRTQQSGSRSTEDADLESEPRSMPSICRPTESGELLTNSEPEEAREPSASQPGFKLGQPGWKSRDLDQEPTPGGCESTCGSEHTGEPKWASEETTNLPPGPSSLQTRALQVESRFQQGSGSGVKPESRPVQTGNGDSDCRLTGSRIPLLPLLSSRVGHKSVFTPEASTGPRHGSRLDHRPESEPHVQEGSTSGLQWDSGSGPEVRSDVPLRATSDQPRSTLFPEPEQNRDLDPVPTSPETPGLQSDLQPGHTGNVHSERELDLEPGSDEEHQPREDPASKDVFHSQVPVIQQSGPGSEVICTTPPGEDQPANHRRELLLSWEHLMDQTWSWVQLGYSQISNSFETGWQISEAEDALNTHVELQTRAEAADQSLKEVLAHTRTCRTSEASRPLTPLKALTEQLRRRTGPAQSDDPAASLSPELARRAALVWSELQSLRMKISSNLLLLRPYVRFFRMVHQVEEDMEELRKAFTKEENQEENQEENKEENQKNQEKNQEKEAESGNDTSSRSQTQKKNLNTSWEEARQKFLTAQELGNSFLSSVATISAAQVDLQMFVAVVQQQMEHLTAIKQEVQELRRHQVQVRQQQAFCRRYQDRLQMTLQNLESVSELLDSCTRLDLGSDLQTSRLLERLSQARPHFTQLDTDVENMKKSWESVRGEQDQLEVQDTKEMLQLQDSVKTKICQVESILDLTSRFHHTARQLEALLQPVPPPGPETREQIQDLFKTTSGLKMEICSAVRCSGWTCFRLEQLEARLGSLDSLCIFFINEASRRENNLHRDVLNGRVSHDITQLRDSFEDLKKRFSNLKLSFLKRNEGSRNVKAIRNQLQQVELYEEKLQVLRKRLQAWTERLGSEVNGEGVRPEAGAAVAELQTQMGELEQSISNHQKTLEMTRKLQQAMEEFQFWCEEASATISRVDKFSSQCGRAGALSALQQQFETFVWPTVPEQEERMSRMVELGEDEGRRYIAKTVCKHSEMVGSIKELSDRLMEMEAKLKLEHLKQQQMEEETKQKMDTDEKDEETEKTNEKNLKEKRRMKITKVDGTNPEELLELKETGHTPELTSKQDGKAVPLKKEVLTSRRPPVQRSSSQEKELRSLNTVSNTSCSLLEVQHQIHTVHASFHPVAMAPEATPPPADASAGGRWEVEVPSEDSLSSDGYECASPDDISLPPLAETPESIVVQWDVEEGFCCPQQPELAPPWGGRPPHHTSFPSGSTAPSLQASSFSQGLQASDPSQSTWKAAGRPESLQRRSSPPSGSNRSHWAGGAITDAPVHVRTFSTDGCVPERDAGSSSWGGPRLSSIPADAAVQQGEAAGPGPPATSRGSSSAKMDFSSSPDHQGPPSGEGNPSCQVEAERGPQLVCSIHECLTSSSSHQHLHEPGMAPSSPAGPAAPQADLHDAHLPAPPHPLTPPADASVCRPRSVCEEIRLTPQVRGPPLPAPAGPPQVEPLPQGKGPKAAPRCFSRPMAGSPVTLEVEVSGHPEPTLTGCRDAPSMGGALPGVPQTSGGGEGWLLQGVFRVLTEDWSTVFGTLCVLLWLLHLLVL